MYWLLKSPNLNLDYGMQLKDFPGGDQSQGVLWWQGAAVSIINIPCDSSYQVMVRVLHSNPTRQGPGQLELSQDFLPIARYTIIEDWDEFRTMMHLTKGLHLLGLSYVEDIGDAVIQRIQLNQIGSCQ
jgi:hypothetical protein